MSLFEFVTVIVSVVLALALGQLLLGIAAMAKNRGRIQPYLPHTLYVAAFLVLPITYWWSLWDFRDLAWSFPTFGYVLIAPTLAFFSVALLIPDELGTAEVDLREHYYKVRPLLLSVALVYTLVSWLDGVLLINQEPFGQLGLAHLPGIVGSGVALVWSHHRVQLANAVLLVLVLAYFVFFVRLLPGLTP